MPTPLVRKLGRCFPLSETDKEVLQRVSTRVRLVAARDDLISEGDATDGIHLVQNGFACRYKVLRNGQRSIMAFLVPGDICDMHVSILSEMDHSIGTLSRCEVATISRDTIEEITTNYPNLKRALRWSALVEEATSREWLVSTGRRPADQRIAHLFCELLMRLQAVDLVTDSGYELPVSQADIADATGLTSVHVNRVLQELRRQGLIVSKGKSLTIPDAERLKEFAQFNPSYLHLEPKHHDRRSPNGNGFDDRLM